jgi:phosphoribosylaminoimidazole carboxylase PurE protein
VAQIHVVLGSENDLPAVQESGMLKILDDLNVSYVVSVCSAHRNLPDLEPLVARCLKDGCKVFIGIAGLAAALPGALAGAARLTPVIGVPLDEYGINSCQQMPPDVPVLTSGAGKLGVEDSAKGALRKAALAACQMLGTGDDRVKAALADYIIGKSKPPKYDILLPDPSEIQRFRREA